MPVKPAFAILIGPFPGPLHGVSVINARLAERMIAQGLIVERIDLSPGRVRRGLVYHGTRMVRTLSGFFRLLGAPLRGRSRVIMSVDGGAGLLYNILLAIAVRLTGQALLFYHHSTHYVLGDSALMRLLLTVAGPNVPHIFCSEKMAALFTAQYGMHGAVMIVNNAAWIDPPEPEPGAGSGGLRLGFLSALTLDKGLGRAIDTLRKLRASGLDAELVLAGAIVDAQAGALVDQAQAEFGPALTYRGVLSGADKAAYYGGLDVFLFPSLYPHETQSLVVPEALAAGTPVIAHDHRFVSEVLGTGGLLVPVANNFALVAAGWIALGQGAWSVRRASARQQFEADAAVAADQLNRLIAWAEGTS